MGFSDLYPLHLKRKSLHYIFENNASKISLQLAYGME